MSDGDQAGKEHFVRVVRNNKPLSVAEVGSTSKSAIVEIAGVDKSYLKTDGSPFAALKDINFTIFESEFVSIVGPSGCGKSTLLRCVAGLESVSSGSITARNQPVKGPLPNLGIVFQRDTLADWRDILDNVLLVSEFRGLDRRSCEPLARELLAKFGLKEFIHHRPWQLSGGMRQRAAICRALVDDPSLLFMDEPFGALDAMTRDELAVEFQRLWSETRKTVLLITHSIPEAVFLSDRVVVMSKNPGKIADIINIDLPRPRHPAIQEAPEFIQYVHKIRTVFTSLGVLKE